MKYTLQLIIGLVYLVNQPVQAQSTNLKQAMAAHFGSTNESMVVGLDYNYFWLCRISL